MFWFFKSLLTLIFFFFKAKPSAFGDVRAPQFPLLQKDDRAVFQEGNPDQRVTTEQRDRMQTDARELATDGPEGMDMGV
jgi:hypothetical protein